MSGSLIIVAPLLRSFRVLRLAAGSEPVQARTESVHLLDDSVATALAARSAGSRVRFLTLSETSLTPMLRQRLEPAGVEVEVIPVEAAGLERRQYLEASGASVRLDVWEPRPPEPADVDRLLDALARQIERDWDLVVVSDDVFGATKVDFAERVVGRVWGLGKKTVLIPDGASLKQAFHTQPCAAFVAESELQAVSPPAAGVTESTEQTLVRIFEDPIRLLIVHRDDGTVLAASRRGREELGPLAPASAAQLMGAIAAGLTVAGDDSGGDSLEAAREGARRVREAAPAAL